MPTKLDHRLSRKKRIRARIIGTADKPRLSVFRSLRFIAAQLIDDTAGKTLAAVNSKQLKQGRTVKASKAVGEALAKEAKTAGVTAVVFDRNGYRYHGCVKALADGAREGGLKF